jgi:hypothetical protein|nr:MAG TPA: hypothetical protein [Caudoviricetes sp.]DAN58149.1 MAG TPA: hypothetical protein [Caudoviricetes sp.]
MNTTDKVINNLGIQLANKTISEAFTLTERDEALAELQQVKAERDEALADFKNIKASFEKINEILQSDERLKNLYEEVKEKQIEKG